jgi:hypothetical protein
MCKILLRFQEHYESPKFRNKVFTLKEYKAWYKAHTKSKKFTYYEDWSGFNFPSSILRPFYKTKFNPLSAGEKTILNIFKKTRGKFYIIAAVDGSVDVKNHEIAHAFYYLDKQYKADIDNFISMVSKKDFARFVGFLNTTGGYHPSVFRDEFQAYAMSRSGDTLFKALGKTAATARRRIISLFKSRLMKTKNGIGTI